MSAAPLVCLHGWGLNLRVFDPLEAALGAHRRLIGIDLPGHGARPWLEDSGSFEAQLDALQRALPSPCILLGWSLGGLFAQALARRCAERVRGLILVASTPCFVARADWPHGMAEPLLSSFAAQLGRDPQATLREFLQLQVRGSRDAAQTLLQLQNALQSHGMAQPAALAAGLEILRAQDLRDSLQFIAVRTLVISGQHDRITPPAAAEYLARQIPDARHLQVPRAGHAPWLSHPAEFAASLREFMAAA